MRILLKQTRSVGKTSVTWQSFVIEKDVNPDGTPGEQSAVIVMAIEDEGKTYTWRCTMPSDYKTTINEDPEFVTHYGLANKTQITDANLDSPRPWLEFNVQHFEKIFRYSIDGKRIEKSQFENILNKLVQIDRTWYCAETAEGGRTGYDAYDENGLKYKVEVATTNHGQFNSIKKLQN
jgi:hypothetical protein